MTEDWILGFVWGVGTISDSRLLVRYHDKDLLEQITARHAKDGSITPLIMHWPDGRQWSIDRVLGCTHGTGNGGWWARYALFVPDC